eukprot:CAMPEP_0194564996 /NCGR_PEP_ID=MMETSP0292-20121207/4423_1 /TAXON_ID=39354 /ORGANISM="Heterosigma akashiwo, Strain CCMP2393" /LENGTH=336 /DNA_ID=CAMNT_0039414227 /DNA_START=573 /DNA_END=1583 /DNA_ORIENTATION=-
MQQQSTGCEKKIRWEAHKSSSSNEQANRIQRIIRQNVGGAQNELLADNFLFQELLAYINRYCVITSWKSLRLVSKATGASVNKHMKQLVLSQNAPVDVIQGIISKMPNLQAISLEGSTTCTNDLLTFVRNRCQSLKFLNISYCQGVTEAFVKNIPASVTVTLQGCWRASTPVRVVTPMTIADVQVRAIMNRTSQGLLKASEFIVHQKRQQFLAGVGDPRRRQQEAGGISRGGSGPRDDDDFSGFTAIFHGNQDRFAVWPLVSSNSSHSFFLHADRCCTKEQTDSIGVLLQYHYFEEEKNSSLMNEHVIMNEHGWKLTAADLMHQYVVGMGAITGMH